MKRLLFFFSFAFLSLFCGHFPGWFDSAELATAVHVLGVAHPPGHGLYVFLGKLLTLIPFGSIGFRLELFSALFTSLSLVILYNVLGLLFSGVLGLDLRARKNQWVLCGLAILPLFHPSIALQSTRIEVYTLELFLLLLCFFWVLKAKLKADVRYLYQAWWVFGLALTLQPLLALLFLPVFLFGHLQKMAVSLRSFGMGLFMTFLGVSTIVYLPARAITHPILNWDDPSTLSRLADLLWAKDFREVLYETQALSSSNLPLLQPSVLILATLGIWFLFRRKKTFLSLTFLTATLSTGSIWMIRAFFLKDLHLQNPDVHAYLMFPLLFLWILATLGATGLLKKPSLALLLTGIAFLHAFPLNLSSFASSGGLQSEALSRHLDKIPPFSAIQVRSDHWIFPLWYRSYVEGRRPDVALAAEGLLNASWYRNQLKTLYSPLSPRLTFYEHTPTPSSFSGYLFHQASVPFEVRPPFQHLCRENSALDPFDIQASVCAQIIRTATTQWLSRKQFKRVKNELEIHFNLEPTDDACLQHEPLWLPYPLVPEDTSRFLEHPTQLKTDLAILWAECGAHMKRLTHLLSPQNQLNANQRLLLGFFEWASGNSKRAFQALEASQRFSKKEQGYLSLARATLHWQAANRWKAEEALERAQNLLGPIPEIQRLKDQINLPESFDASPKTGSLQDPGEPL